MTALGGTSVAAVMPGFSIVRLLIAVCAGVVFFTPLQAVAGDRTPSAGKLPAFSWDRVPQYMHIRKWTEYTPAEIEYLATFPLVTLEKANGTRVFDTNEDGTLAAARAIKKVNPATKILYYRNVIVHYPGYRDDEAINAIPGGFLVGRRGQGKLIRRKLEAYDLTKPEVREWWVANPGSVCADPAIDGLFLDGIIKILQPGFLKRFTGAEKQATMVAGYQAMVEETRKALGPDKIMLANVVRAGTPDSGLVEIQRFDGSYLEGFEGGKDHVAQGIEAFQKAAREGYLMTFTAGLSDLNTEEGERNPLQTDEIREGLAAGSDFSKRFHYLLAIFLICAEEHSYFLAHDGYLADKSKVWMKRLPELERPLGPPKGPAIRNGDVYTREFAHAKVRLDIENQTGEIEWIASEES
jgi:hypothetical protein